MKNYKVDIASNGQELHYSVGALIERDGKYLMIDRTNPPFGFAGIGGHIDEGENPEDAIVREVEEESGLKVKSFEQIGEEEILWNFCKSGTPVHYWRLYKCDTEGEVKGQVEEMKSIKWYTKEELEKLPLEPAWRYWFEKIGIVKKKKKVTLCGSTKFFDKMLSVKEELERKGFVVETMTRFLDKQEDADVYEDYSNKVWDIKKNAILAHFRLINWADAILVVNEEKNGVSGYIGGNVLMEIGFALWYNKKIFYMYETPKEVSYREELFGVKPTILGGDLNKLDF